MTPACMGMVFLRWQRAQAWLHYRGHIFYHYHLPWEGTALGGWGGGVAVGGAVYDSSLPSFGQHIKKPNYTQPHTWPGLAQLSVWEMYKTGCLCVHTGISGIRDKAAVHDHIKPLAGIVMPLLWCNRSIVRACVCARVCVCSQASCLFAYFNVQLFSFCRMHWSISHCNCVGNIPLLNICLRDSCLVKGKKKSKHIVSNQNTASANTSFTHK